MFRPLLHAATNYNMEVLYCPMQPTNICQTGITGLSVGLIYISDVHSVLLICIIFYIVKHSGDSDQASIYKSHKDCHWSCNLGCPTQCFLKQCLCLKSRSFLSTWSAYDLCHLPYIFCVPILPEHPHHLVQNNLPCTNWVPPCRQTSEYQQKYAAPGLQAFHQCYHTLPRTFIECITLLQILKYLVTIWYEYSQTQS